MAFADVPNRIIFKISSTDWLAERQPILVCRRHVRAEDSSTLFPPCPLLINGEAKGALASFRGIASATKSERPKSRKARAERRRPKPTGIASLSMLDVFKTTDKFGQVDKASNLLSVQASLHRCLPVHSPKHCSPHCTCLYCRGRECINALHLFLSFFLCHHHSSLHSRALNLTAKHMQLLPFYKAFSTPKRSLSNASS